MPTGAFWASWRPANACRGRLHAHVSLLWAGGAGDLVVVIVIACTEEVRVDAKHRTRTLGHTLLGHNGRFGVKLVGVGDNHVNGVRAGESLVVEDGMVDPLPKGELDCVHAARGVGADVVGDRGWLLLVG